MATKRISKTIRLVAGKGQKKRDTAKRRAPKSQRDAQGRSPNTRSSWRWEEWIKWSRGVLKAVDSFLEPWRQIFRTLAEIGALVYALWKIVWPFLLEIINTFRL